jgi:hypothetical protein
VSPRDRSIGGGKSDVRQPTGSESSHQTAVEIHSERPLAVIPSPPLTDAVTLGLDQAEYEPEQHPALIYRPEDPAVVVLVFSSGKLVITGMTDPTPAHTALTELADQLPPSASERHDTPVSSCKTA